MSESRNVLAESRRATDSEVEENQYAEVLRNAWMLSRREISRGWISYPLTAAFHLLFGLIAGGLLFTSLYDWQTDPSQAQTFFTSNGSLDFLFLVFASGLAVNMWSESWSYPWRDVFYRRFVFLRVLPIATRDLVAGRTLATLLTLAFATMLFFLPAYLFAILLGTEEYVDAVSSQLGPVQYLWFVAVWVMYGLVFGGAYLFMELGFRGKVLIALQGVWFALIAFLVLVIGPAIGGIVAGTIRLVQQYGPLPALVAAFFGVPLFLLWTVAAKRRLERRDLET